MSAAFKFFIQFVTYGACYCAVCLSAGAYVTSRLAREGAGVSVPSIVVIALAGFFGLFSFAMATVSHQYALTNKTNIETLSARLKAYTLAIRIPLDQTPAPASSSEAKDYATITFPLPDPNFDGNQFIYDNAGADRSGQPVEHKFAIVTADIGENPWDTGSYYKNWTSVMGNGLVDWLLPLRLSPCCENSGTYPTGPLIDKLRERLKEEYE